ncbi:MAG: phosphotransferase [Desulfobacterales bacterium]|jgi:homoserine kinase type II
MIEQAVRILKEHYNLGDLSNAEELLGGTVNRSFAVTAQKKDHPVKYFIRQYNPAIAENEIRFEHALISHLKKNGFDLAAGVIPSKTGATYIKQESAAEGRTQSDLWAVYEFIEGEDRYAWFDTHIAPEDMISAAEVLADLHAAGQDFRKPKGCDRRQPPIMEFLPTFRQIYSACSSQAGKTRFDQRFLQNHDRILRAIDQALIPEGDRSEMPCFPIHCDYHQGNLKYQGSRVTGIFDFDWSKIDLRLFDLALALLYFCACWDGPEAGNLMPDKFELFLQAYNDRCASKVRPGSLTKREKTFLPAMLAAANLFVLHWTIVDFYRVDNPDTDEYLVYLNHHLKLINWLEYQNHRIAGIINQTV